jgi:glycosyltransferase involved in cell wall biosynthesis
MRTIVLGVPVLSRYDLLERLLASAEAGTSKPDRYLIVDNGGKFDAGSAAVTRAIARGATVSVLSPGKNLGVAASWNAILTAAHPATAIVSNDDITLGPETLARLAASDADFTIAEGPPHANGWCLFAQTARCTERVGLYDTLFYPAYYEDTDYHRRLTLAGIEPLRLPTDHAHEGWATIKLEGYDGPTYQGQKKNLDYYVEKWGGPPGNERFTRPFNGARIPGTPGPPSCTWVDLKLSAPLSGPLMRYDVINRILQTVGAHRYLEIGVSSGETMRQVRASHRVGVDPSPHPDGVRAATEFFSVPSDVYFAEKVTGRFDVAFVDGLHHADQAYRDIEHACLVSTVVVVHDANPSTEAMQIVPPVQGEWTGDVWKAVARIRAEGRHTVRTIDTDYGVAVVLPHRAEAVPLLPRETWDHLVTHRKALLGLVSPREWEAWFDAARADKPAPTTDERKRVAAANRRARRAAAAQSRHRPVAASSRPAKLRICLNMIVKNERSIIERCLTAALPHIDMWVIADTGSTDGTAEAIEQFFGSRGVPGKLVQTRFLDFAQARNEALAAARAIQDWTYALLIDADMVLVGSIDKRALTLPAYRIEQRTGNLAYWNTRLVRRDAVAKYVGVTHEFLSVDGPTPTNLDSLYVDDRNDGGSKGDKSERDIRLLAEGLTREPNNERYLFYLAQTYREAGRHHEAIQRYTQRIAVGGWDEEVWAAYYGIARSRAALGDEAALVLACFDAYNYRPARAEPLALLAQFWRERGKSDAAVLIAEEVARTPRPADILFVEDDVYTRKSAVDVAISGYYSKRPARREAGYEACARLTIDRDPNLRENARKNFVHYAKSARDFGATIQPIDWKPEDGYAPMNPSVLAAGGRRLVLLRTVNYRVTDGQYPTLDGSGIIRTKNYVAEMDADWRPSKITPVVDATGLPRTSFAVSGFEDCRLYPVGDRIAASATARDLGDGRAEQCILAFDADWRIESARVIRDYEHEKMQKNWMPILGQPDAFLYRCDPTTVIDCAPSGTRERSRVTDLEENLTELRGSSQVLSYQDGWIGLVHEVVLTPGRVYLHRFVRLGADFAIRAVSEPFYFLERGIEFCAGLAQDGERLVASFGVNDASAHLAFFDRAAVDKLIG